MCGGWSDENINGRLAQHTDRSEKENNRVCEWWTKKKENKDRMDQMKPEGDNNDDDGGDGGEGGGGDVQW